MRKIDATSGPLMKLMIIYTIPLIISSLIQHLFTIVDQAVLGHMADTSAVASVGASGNITTLIINGFIGLSSGATLALARYVGQQNEEKIRKTIDTSLVSGLGFGVIVGIFGYALSPMLLDLTLCPKECYDGALLYLRIRFIFAPVELFNNYGTGILRTLGDTRRPLIYVTAGGLVNVVLNVILCLILPQKVAAVAIATVMSHVVSAVCIMWRLCHWEDSARVTVSKMALDKDTFKLIIKLGIPVAIYHLIFPLANLQITPAVNSFGVDSTAGRSAANSIYNLASAFTAGFGVATTTFIGQNLGAKQYDRVKLSFRYSLIFNVLISGGLGAVCYLTGETLLGLVLGKGATAAIGFGMIYLFYVSLFSFVSAANTTLRSTVQAYGYPTLASISSVFFTLVFRVIWMQFIYPLNPTYPMIMLCFTVSWTLNCIFLSASTAVLNYRFNKGIYKEI